MLGVKKEPVTPSCILDALDAAVDPLSTPRPKGKSKAQQPASPVIEISDSNEDNMSAHE